MAGERTLLLRRHEVERGRLRFMLGTTFRQQSLPIFATRGQFCLEPRVVRPSRTELAVRHTYLGLELKHRRLELLHFEGVVRQGVAKTTFRVVPFTEARRLVHLLRRGNALQLFLCGRHFGLKGVATVFERRGPLLQLAPRLHDLGKAMADTLPLGRLDRDGREWAPSASRR